VPRPQSEQPPKDNRISDITKLRPKSPRSDTFLVSLLRSYERLSSPDTSHSHNLERLKSNLPVKQVVNKDVLSNREMRRNLSPRRRKFISLERTENVTLSLRNMEVETVTESVDSVNSSLVFVRINNSPLLLWDYTRPAYFPWRSVPDECSNYAIRLVIQAYFVPTNFLPTLTPFPAGINCIK